MIIITYHNFSFSSFVITSWSSLHTASFPLSRTLKLHNHVCLPQLFHFFPCYNLMIITYRNFFTSSFVITSFFLHYVPQLFQFLLCYNFMMINTYRNVSTFSFVITSWWSLHTATIPTPNMLYFHDDHYIPQLFHFLLTGLPVRPSHKMGFRSSAAKNGHPGEGRHEGLVPRNDVLTNGFIWFSLARTLARILFVPRLRAPWKTHKALRTWRRLCALFEVIRS